MKTVSKVEAPQTEYFPNRFIILPFHPASSVTSLGEYHCHTQLLKPETWNQSLVLFLTATHQYFLNSSHLYLLRILHLDTSLPHCHQLSQGRIISSLDHRSRLFTGLPLLPPDPSDHFPIPLSKLHYKNENMIISLLLKILQWLFMNPNL